MAGAEKRTDAHAVGGNMSRPEVLPHRYLVPGTLAGFSVDPTRLKVETWFASVVTGGNEGESHHVIGFFRDSDTAEAYGRKQGAWGRDGLSVPVGILTDDRGETGYIIAGDHPVSLMSAVATEETMRHDLMDRVKGLNEKEKEALIALITKGGNKDAEE